MTAIASSRVRIRNGSAARPRVLVPPDLAAAHHGACPSARSSASSRSEHFLGRGVARRPGLAPLVGLGLRDAAVPLGDSRSHLIGARRPQSLGYKVTDQLGTGDTALAGHVVKRPKELVAELYHRLRSGHSPTIALWSTVHRSRRRSEVYDAGWVACASSAEHRVGVLAETRRGRAGSRPLLENTSGEAGVRYVPTGCSTIVNIGLASEQRGILLDELLEGLVGAPRHAGARERLADLLERALAEPRRQQLADEVAALVAPGLAAEVVAGRGGRPCRRAPRCRSPPSAPSTAGRSARRP